MATLGIPGNIDNQLSEKVRGKGVEFERIRRITGYLVGTLNRFNGGKRAEVEDRVKHDAFVTDNVNIETREKMVV